MLFSIDPDEAFSFTPKIPAELTRYLLPVSSGVSAASNESMQLLLQESATDDCKVFHSVYYPYKDTRLHIRDEGPFFFLCLALQHDRQLRIPGLGNIHLREGQFNLFYAPGFNISSFHEAGRETVTLSLQYALENLDEWTAYFPQLLPFLDKVRRKEPALWLEGNRWINRPIQDTIYSITRTAQDMVGRPLYLDLLLKTLLFHLLHQSVQQQPASPYSHYEIDNIHAARELIRANIRQHLPIPEIARMVGVNEFKLKTGFREIFGNGVYEYLRIERMLEARRLLEDSTLSIKEIAGRTGYKSVNSFIKTFKRQSGKTPGEYRDKS